MRQRFLTMLAAVVVAALLLAQIGAAHAVTAPISPSRSHSEPLSVPLQHHPREADSRIQKRSRQQTAAWANAQKAHLLAKYRLSKSSPEQQQPARRQDDTSTASATAGIRLTNFKHDSSWSGTVYIGTPPKPYDLLLDTGSSDLWVAADRFHPEESSTFTQDPSSVFDAQYGSGNVSGFIGHDVVGMGRPGSLNPAGGAYFVSSNQTLAVATRITSSLKTGDSMAGIMGLAFESLAGTEAAPFWLAANVTERRFGVFLRRQLTSLTDVSPATLAPGGMLTLGGANTSLFVAGTENAVDVLERAYWLVNLAGLSIGGTKINVQNLQRSAIDTGTTLIGGPDDLVAQIYAQVPGSQPMNGAPGYYVYPCASTPKAALAFGNTWYTLADIDFVGDIASGDLSYCMGVFFGLGTVATDNLHFIIGAAFLKNVYTIFDAGTAADGTSSGGSGSGGGGAGNKARVIFAALTPGLNSGTKTTGFHDIPAAAAARITLPLRSTGLVCFVLSLALALVGTPM